MNSGRRRKPIHGGDIRATARRYGLDASQIIDFSASINPRGPAPGARRAIMEELNRIQHYPEPGAESLRKALAAWRGMNEACVVPGNGSMELMYLAMRLFNPSRVVRLVPSYREYGQGGMYTVPNLLIELRPEQGFVVDIDAIAAVMTRGDLLFIGHPNNPTGRMLTRSGLQALVQLVEEREAGLVIDEAFIDFAGPGAPSAADLAVKSPRILVLGSLTKFFALPGLRLGYAIAHPERAQHMEWLLPPWRLNSLAVAAGIASLQDNDYTEQTLMWLEESRTALSRSLKEIRGLQVYPSETNFLLVCCRESGFTAAQIQEKLGPQGIMIRDCSDFEALDSWHFRVAVRSPREHRYLIKALLQLHP